MYKEVVSPILDRLDSETMHVAARKALNYAESSPLTAAVLRQFNYGRQRFFDPHLNVNLRGIHFDNPVMVGAGWDKVGEAVRGLYDLGFSGVEVGSVLLHPQPGNPKPRQFMIGPGVALNRLGFNSPGVDVVRKNLEVWGYRGIPVGISLGKNKETPDSQAPEVHAEVARRLYDHASYFAINVSSPNTPGLRALQDKGPLTDIVQAVNVAMDERGGRKPTFVKIAPDLTNTALDDIIEVVLNNRLTGIIATNTTIRAGLKAKYGENWRNEMGGLSGDDEAFRRMSTEKVAHIYKQTRGRLAIIGVGGVKDATTALQKIKAGAKIVQVVTAIRGEGPTVAGRINKGIVRIMEKIGIKDLSEIVGSEAHRY